MANRYIKESILEEIQIQKKKMFKIIKNVNILDLI